MRKNATLTCLLGAIAWCLAVAGADAQQLVEEIDIKGIEVILMPTPQFEFQGETKRLPKSREWVEIEVEFEIEGKTANGYYDDVEFTFYVVMENGETMYVERANYVNIKDGEESFVSVYIAPATVEKLLGKEATSDSVVAGVAVEARFQGAIKGKDATVKPDTNWWMSKAQTQGGLLKKSKTPFAPLWFDRYAEEKQDR